MQPPKEREEQLREKIQLQKELDALKQQDTGSRPRLTDKEREELKKINSKAIKLMKYLAKPEAYETDYFDVIRAL